MYLCPDDRAQAFLLNIMTGPELEVVMELVMSLDVAAVAFFCSS